MGGTKRNAQAKEGLKEKTLKLKFLAITVKILDSRDCDPRLMRSEGILCIVNSKRAKESPSVGLVPQSDITE